MNNWKKNFWRYNWNEQNKISSIQENKYEKSIQLFKNKYDIYK